MWDWKKRKTLETGAGTFRVKTVRADRFDPADLKDGKARFDAALLPCPLRIGSWRNGDVILSFDGKRKNLKKLFCDRHISGQARAETPVLRDETGEALYVPGLRTGAKYKITEKTDVIAEISFHFHLKKQK